jgi:hypothetical protein
MNIFKFNKTKQPIISSLVFLTTAIALVGSGVASAAPTTTTSNNPTTSTSNSTEATKQAEADQAQLQLIITKGTAEIDRRLTTLSTLDTKINSSTKISSADKTSLTSEVNNEVSGLTALKTNLAATTTVALARSYAQSIINDYRVYALVVPQVNILKTADDQQLVEAKLNTLETSLATRINSSTNTSLVAELTAMTTQTKSAESLSSSVESSVLSLTPSNYDSNHSLLVQYINSLKTASSDNQAAIASGKSIVSSLVKTKQ